MSFPCTYQIGDRVKISKNLSENDQAEGRVVRLPTDRDPYYLVTLDDGWTFRKYDPQYLIPLPEEKPGLAALYDEALAWQEERLAYDSNDPLVKLGCSSPGCGAEALFVSPPHGRDLKSWHYHCRDHKHLHDRPLPKPVPRALTCEKCVRLSQIMRVKRCREYDVVRPDRAPVCEKYVAAN